ncbi:MAG: response regulator transcription factor [Candidatus Melainabacteria bacterium]|nr:response regulator transcription factor [Candidatus Melainabacteria bacterium]
MDDGEAQKINIFIAEDHEITRVGLRLTLERVPGFSVVGEAADGKMTVKKVIELKPQVVLMDIGLPVMDGIEATTKIKLEVPGTRVIMLTSHDSDRDIFAALGAGADGYCLKEVSGAQLVMAIRAVADGVAWLAPGVASRVLRACAAASPAPGGETSAKANALASPLSQRELEVLKLVVDGSSNQEIADKLILSVETVKTHMRHIMEKLAVSDRTQAAVKAMREGLV